MTDNPYATVETERLILRPLTPADLDAYQAAVYGDAEVMRYLPGGQPRPIERTAQLIAFFDEHWKAHGFSAWAVVEKASGELIGHAGLLYIGDTGAVELMYALAKSAWGKGYATEAARAALQFGFETVKLDEIHALAFAENTASQQVMRKLGMIYQGATDRFHSARLEWYLMTREMHTGMAHT